MNKKFKSPLKIFISAGIIFFSVLFVYAAVFDINASLDKKTAYVGDIIKYKVTVELEQNAYLMSDEKIIFNNFETLDCVINHISIRPNIYEIIFDVSAYDTGSFEIESVGLSYIDEEGKKKMFFTPAQSVEILPFAGENVKDISDIKPLKLSVLDKKKAISVVFCLFLFVLSAFFTVKNINEKRLKIKKETDPGFEALMRLDALFLSDLIKKGDARAFYYEVSAILRKYLSYRYAFDAMEMTSGELIQKLEADNSVAMTRGELKSYLYIFDIARYAGFKACERDMIESLNKTKEFINQI